jgi:hypothetical protein
VSSIRPQDEGNMIVGSRSAVPDDIKADIARVVRSIKFTGSTGGDCLLRGRDRPPRVATFGWKPKFCVGGMLYCAGPSAIRDTMVFCAQGNAGQMVDRSKWTAN